ncbi:MAG: thioredoxin fold domain-containing protein [Prevotellaceae bacterium]|jgi:thioredoxin-related protein|nr:thioredoxin fold domain-containing protein [Prevotellaceae bacterium]
MKKIFFALIISLIASIPVVSQGIHFENTSFNEGLSKAKTEKKLLFIDCYTAWCSPCKLLATKIFTQDSVGTFFNAHFVNLQIDMEKGEGVELAKRFGVTSYPTMLIISLNGEVQHKIIGYQPAKTLIDKAAEGLNEKTSMRNIKKVYEQGNRKTKVVTAYIQTLIEGKEIEKAATEANKFLSSIPNKKKVTTDLWPLYSNPQISDWGSSSFNFLIQHKAEFDKIMSKEIVDSFIYEAATNLFTTMLFKGKEPYNITYIPEFIKTLREINFSQKEKVIAEAEFTIALTSQNAEETVRLYQKYGKEFSNKGIVNLFPIMLQNKSQLNAEKHGATVKLVELLETKK